jgi:hypothetical protein
MQREYGIPHSVASFHQQELAAAGKASLFITATV